MDRDPDRWRNKKRSRRVGTRKRIVPKQSEYASASTIYLRTRRPDSTSLTASYGYGSFNTHKANITYSYKRLALVDAQYTHTDGNYPFRYHTEYEDTTGRRRNSDLDQMRIEGVLFHGPLQWHTYYYLSYRGLPGGIVRRLSDQYTDVGREWDQNFFTQLSWQDQLRGCDCGKRR